MVPGDLFSLPALMNGERFDVCRPPHLNQPKSANNNCASKPTVVRVVDKIISLLVVNVLREYMKKKSSHDIIPHLRDVVFFCSS